MSQLFSGDSVNNAASTTVPVGTETTGVVGNFVNPPFGNAKAIVLATVNMLWGTGAAAGTVRIRRNPNAENAIVGASMLVTAVAGQTVQLSIQAADAIPDGRPVQYAITVTQPGGSASGTISFANVSTFLISG